MKTNQPKEKPSRNWLDLLSFIFLRYTLGRSYNFSLALGIALILLGIFLGASALIRQDFLQAAVALLLILVGALTCRKAVNNKRNRE